MTPEVAAKYLGVALGTLRNWTSARYVPFVRRGRVVRYHRDQLDRWLSKGGCPGRATLPDVKAGQSGEALS
jgi:excisionase family DNA binding protein